MKLNSNNCSISASFYLCSPRIAGINEHGLVGISKI